MRREKRKIHQRTSRRGNTERKSSSTRHGPRAHGRICSAQAQSRPAGRGVHRQTGAPEGAVARGPSRGGASRVRAPSRGPRSPTPCPAAGAAGRRNFAAPRAVGPPPRIAAFPLRGVATRAARDGRSGQRRHSCDGVVGATCQSAMHVVHLAANWQRQGASEMQPV